MRCARQAGAAVILAMITVLLCAGIAAAAIATVGRSIDGAQGAQDQAQARLLARAAIDWARNVLADDRIRTAVDHTGQPWAVRVPPTPVEQGEVSGEIIDLSGRFNLNNLSRPGVEGETAIAAFSKLLTLLDYPAAAADRLATQLNAHLAPPEPDALPDQHPHTTPSTLVARRKLLDLGELRALPGFDTALIDKLAPFVSVVPAPSKININTASAEVIAAIVPELSLDAARVLVAEREHIWYRNIADFISRLPIQAPTALSTRVEVRSRFFLVTGRAQYGVSTVRMSVLLDRKEIWPDILWQKIL